MLLHDILFFVTFAIISLTKKFIMKKVILFLLLALPFFTYAQDKDLEDLEKMTKTYTTSVEEFKYCSVGYKTQISTGLDAMKKGYDIKKIITYPMSSYGNSNLEVKIVGMYLANTDIVKGYIVIVDPNGSYPEYTAFSSFFSSPEVKKMELDQLDNIGSSRLKTYIVTLNLLNHFRDIQRKYPKFVEE